MIHHLYSLFDRMFRESRNALFIKTLGITPETTVLDVGGTPDFWRKMPIRPRVTLVNLRDFADSEFPSIVASACRLPIADKSFDIVFSNSMIEHLETWENQVRAAQEMLRVGKKIWVQTPNRAFPIDPHLLIPFVHWLPYQIQLLLFPRTVARVLWKLPAEKAKSIIREFRLLNQGEFRTLFPQCKILKEEVGGLVKSFIAVQSEELGEIDRVA